MSHEHHAPHGAPRAGPGGDRHDHHGALTPADRRALDRLSLAATIHCLSGCSVGEVLGMVLGSAFGWTAAASITVSIVLAFAFGYALTLRPLLRAGLGLGISVRLALASDTLSIGTMEVVDNAVMVVIPGAMDAPLGSFRFWGSLALSLVLAGVVAFPVNRWLIAKGRGHALVHGHHGGHGGPRSS